MMNYSRSAALLVAGVGTCALTLSLAVPASAQEEEDQATLSVFQAVPDLTVDVYADGERLLTDVEPGTLADPQELDAGSYEFQIFEAGADAESDDPAFEDTVELSAGDNTTLVAHLSADGDRQLSAFDNDVSVLDDDGEDGQTRLTVRHVAAAPEVDVRVDGDTAFEGLENSDEDESDQTSGTVEVDVVLAGTEEVVIGPTDVELTADTSVIVYAWGSAEDDNLELAIQTITELEEEDGVDLPDEEDIEPDGDGTSY